MANKDTNVQQMRELCKTEHANKQLVQQVFHKGMFNTVSRTRSNSTGDIHRATSNQDINNVNPNSCNEISMSRLETPTTNQPINLCFDSEIPNIPDQVPWQKVPGTNKKRNCSPELHKTTHKLQKRNAERQQLFNKNRPQEVDTATLETSNSFSLLTEDLGEKGDQNSTGLTKPKKVSKPPPIILYGIVDVKLTDFINEAVRKEDYSNRIISKKN